jgi:putative DNA primase/helicase
MSGEGKIIELAPTPRQQKARKAKKPANGSAVGEDTSLPPEFSEEALALRFLDRHAAELRYVSAWNRWLRWDGTRWKVDDTLLAFDLSRAIARDSSAACPAPRTAAMIASAKTVAAIERLARADRLVAGTVDQWDGDLWLLNTPAGTIDLRSGSLRPHRRADYNTKSTAVAPGGGCPNWLAFLERVTGGNNELIAFIQRMAGYALTGCTSEHALFFLHGTGANGKSVLINTLAWVLGDYATTAPMETFIASSSDRHPTELASLRGARLVTAVETDEGRRWNESRIKSLTGGDEVSVRFMRQDFFQYIPQFKLVIAGNHKPGLRGVDEAIRRRMHLVPFTVTIPPDERDEHLAERLRDEGPGILQWMIDGCLDWIDRGLQPPEIVRKATEEYLADEDALGQFLNERCIVKAGYYSLVRDLFSRWKKFCEPAEEPPRTQKWFSQALQARGFVKRLEGGTARSGFDGIGIRTEYAEGEDD